MACPPPRSFTSGISSDLNERIAWVVEMMREISRQTDPQELVRAYSRRVRQLVPVDASISLSRRDLVYPHYRITRFSGWENAPNPWKSRDSLPVLKGGLLAELIYKEEPTIIDALEVSPDDPAFEFTRGQGSLFAIPLYDQGRALNMVILLRKAARAFPRDFVPEHLWVSNLFGRATQNLVLSHELHEAYQAVDRELQVVADIQRSLLPVELPRIPTLTLAAHYQTSRRAGGDYYDFFELPDGRWGILIADVSGHGTPAAVIMAVMHSIAHTHHEEPDPPSKLLNFINRHMSARYTNGQGTFITAFYGIYDPKTRTIKYANAGHNPPRHKRCGRAVVGSLEGGVSLPLGIEPDEVYTDQTQQLEPQDSLVLYTDGITEARGPGNELFGNERLDNCLVRCESDATELMQSVLAAVEQFTGGAPPTDDRTLLIAKVS